MIDAGGVTATADGAVIGGRYSIVRRLGGGGEADVYLASDLELDLEVVLKCQLVTDSSRLTDFRREASMLMRITPHRGLPVVRSDLVDGDRYYLVSDFAAGDDLATIVAVHRRDAARRRARPGRPDRGHADPPACAPARSDPR